MVVMKGGVMSSEVREEREVDGEGGTRKKYKERGGCIIRVCDEGFSLTPHVV